VVGVRGLSRPIAALGRDPKRVVAEDNGEREVGGGLGGWGVGRGGGVVGAGVVVGVVIWGGAQGQLGRGRFGA